MSHNGNKWRICSARASTFWINEAIYSSKNFNTINSILFTTNEDFALNAKQLRKIVFASKICHKAWFRNVPNIFQEILIISHLFDSNVSVSHMMVNEIWIYLWTLRIDISSPFNSSSSENIHRFINALFQTPNDSCQFNCQYTKIPTIRSQFFVVSVYSIVLYSVHFENAQSQPSFTARQFDVASSCCFNSSLISMCSCEKKHWHLSVFRFMACIHAQ